MTQSGWRFAIDRRDSNNHGKLLTCETETEDGAVEQNEDDF